MKPCEGHLKWMIKVLGYVDKYNKGKIMIEPNHTPHASFDCPEHN